MLNINCKYSISHFLNLFVSARAGQPAPRVIHLVDGKDNQFWLFPPNFRAIIFTSVIKNSDSGNKKRGIFVFLFELKVMKRCKYILLTMAMLFGIAPFAVPNLSTCMAQERKVQHRPYLDNRRLH